MLSIRQKIMDALLAMPGVSASQLETAQEAQRIQKVSFGEVLVAQGIISEKDLFLLLVRELHIPSINLAKFRMDPQLRELVPERLARQYNMVPISLMGDHMTVAISDPLNVFAVDDLRDLTGKGIDIVMGTPLQIREALDKFYGAPGEDTVADVAKGIDIGDLEIMSASADRTEFAETGAADQAPIIRMVNLVIKEAIQQRASDIHMEPTETNMRVRYRVDGVLLDVLEIPRESRNSVVVRIKIISRIDITVNQVPQDGRFRMRVSGKEVDFRVSILPTSHGSKIVMRILDKAKLSVGLGHLGFSQQAVTLIDEAIVKPFGMILVTGPTGSGKSTTLYSIISKLNTIDKNIITIEDPVEYLVDGLTQIEARSEIGLTFAAGLRAVLRQSPDIVMVGEIRDNETADIAIKAALTGQLVLSTLHTNDAAGAMTRLVDMGVEPFLVASCLVLICSQRLARKICPHCKKEVEIPEETLQSLHLPADKKIVFFEGQGCERCRHTGYLGRFGLTEILVVDDAIREMLLQGKSSDEIRDYARSVKGMKLLWDDALDSLAQGKTTLAEVCRVASFE
jgi:type IV pilus assembly protein PilB